MWKPTGATVTEASKERVGPTTLGIRVQRQVLGVIVGRDLHSCMSLYELISISTHKAKQGLGVNWAIRFVPF